MNATGATSSYDQSSTNIEEKIITPEIRQIMPDPAQPRKTHDEKGLDELAESIKANGVIHPILVRQVEDNKYIIVSGERRWLATGKAGKTNIPARIVHGDYEIVALSENLARKDLLAIEESMASAKLLERMQGDNAKAKQRELASKLGIAESTMSEILKPAELPEYIKQEALGSPLWSRFKLLKLAKIADTKKQKVEFETMKKIIAQKTKVK